MTAATACVAAATSTTAAKAQRRGVGENMQLVALMIKVPNFPSNNDDDDALWGKMRSRAGL